MAFEKRALGNSGYEVFPLAVGGGYAPRGKVFEMAFERGVNYFFWAPTFPTYIPMTRWLRGKFKSQREKIVLGTTTYFWRIPRSLHRSIHRHLRWLGTDHVDYFHLGWITGNDRRALDELLKFKDQGIVRHIAFSCHNRALAAELVKEWPVELAMVRYNAAHRGAESDFFPHVDTAKTPVVGFNATKHKALMKAPSGWPKDKPVPTATDCYRFVLSHPKVTLCLAGPSNTAHLEQALHAVEKGSMNSEELAWMREFGDRVYGKH